MFSYFMVVLLQGNEERLFKCSMAGQVWALQGGTVCTNQTPLVLEGKIKYVYCCDQPITTWLVS